MKISATIPRACVVSLAVFACGCAQPPAASPQSDAGLVASSMRSLSEPVESRECCKEPDEKTVADPLPLQPSVAIADGESYRRTAWVEPGDRGTGGVLDLTATDQDGRMHRATDLGGRPIALSFLYTRCTNSNKCPLVAARMARLESLLAAEGLDARVSLIIVTYDPAFDTPERLKQYGLRHGLRFTPNVLMLRPDDREKDRFLDQLEVAVNYNAEGVNVHGLQLFLFDDRGRFVRRYQSVIWDNFEVLADLKRLAGEVR